MKLVWLRTAYLTLGLALGLELGSMAMIKYIWPWEILYRSVYTVFYSYGAGCIDRSVDFRHNVKDVDYCMNKALLKAKDLMTIYDNYEKNK
jgi:hypothetical protein